MAGDSKPSLEEILRGWDEKLGPFDPSQLAPPPEFLPPMPRPIPSALSAGSHERSTKAGLIGCAAIGVILCLLQCTGLHRTMGFYIWGLAYAGWIGLGILLLVGLATIWHFASIGLFEYVRDGELIPARVLRAEAWKGGQQGLQFGYEMSVEIIDPESGKRTMMQLTTGVVHGVATMAQHEFRARPGDYIHLVWLPGKPFLKSLKIYGMMGLNPDYDLVWRNGKPRPPTSPFEPLIAVGVLLGLGLCGLAVYYSISYFSPIHPTGGFYFASGLCALAAAVLTGVIGSKFVDLVIKPPRSDMDGYAMTILAAMVAAVALGYLGPAAVNVGLDRSAPRFEAVEIVNYWQRRFMVFRSFDFAYVEADGTRGWYPSTPGHMTDFPDTGMAALETHSGFLGWPWIREVHPVMLIKATEENGRRVTAIDAAPATGSYRPAAVSFLDRGVFALNKADTEWVWQRLAEKGAVKFAPGAAPGS